jgi:uncharacterized protein (TIGR02594 family)
MTYNANIAALQSQLGMEPDDIDGINGPKTSGLILKAAESGRVTIAPLPEKAAVSALPWINEILTVFGLHEKKDKTKLAAWLKSDGKTLGDPTALPWCGDAVETAIKKAVPAEPFPGAVGENPYFARNWAHFGRACGLVYGCIGVFSRGPTSGHVGFLIGQDADEVFVLGGNQGDSISVVAIAKSRLLATRWPVTFTGPEQPLPAMSGADIPKSVNEF